MTAKHQRKTSRVLVPIAIFTVAASAIVLGVNLWHTLRQFDRQTYDISINIVWSANQLNNQYNALVREVDTQIIEREYHYEPLMLKIDLLWSRLNVSRDSDLSRHIVTVQRAAEYLGILEANLERLDILLAEFEEAPEATLLATKKLLDDLEPTIRTYNSDVYLALTENVAAWRGDQADYLRRLFYGFGALMILTLGALVMIATAYRLAHKGQTRAEQSNLAKSRFLAMMSHEIRTPMNGVLGMLEVMRDETDPDRRQAAHAIALTAAQHMNRLLGDVLDASRMERGTLAIHRSTTDLRQVLKDVADLMATDVETQGNAFDVDIDDHLAQPAWVDGGRIRQIAIILLSNASKFTQAGTITLSAHRRDDDTAIISVSDTGIGMNEAQLAIVFEPFKQAHEGADRQYGGSGLGLSICKQLVEAHDGRISMTSAPHQGTTVTLELPLHTAQAANRNERPQVAPTPPASQSPTVPAAPAPAQGERVSSAAVQHPSAAVRHPGLRVLVVDDSPVNLAVAKALLQRQGFTVTTFDGAEKALAYLEDLPPGALPDAVFMDISMPGMDGYQGTLALRALPDPANKLRVLALTAHAFEEDRERAAAVGMDGYVTKPIQMEALLSELERLGINPPNATRSKELEATQ